MFAHGSGRRVGAIGADRLGWGADGLRRTDFSVEGGRLHVTWRAAAAKGKSYGRGDEELVATRLVAVAYRWLRRCHPNPLGPEHPLIWSPDDPTRPVTYAALNRAFKEAWRVAFNEDAPRGVAFHGFCRTVVTTIVDALGMSHAAEYTGRTIRTIERHYKRRRSQTQVRTTAVLDEIRAEAVGREGPNRNPNRNLVPKEARKQRKTRAFRPGLNSRGRTRTYDPLINSQML